MRKGVLICALIILSFISMSCICAVDVNDDSVASQNSTAIDLSQIDENDEISLPDESQVVGQTDNQEMISADAKGTFADLESEIQNGYGSTITLGRNYEYEGTGYSDGITINNPITIDGKGHIIDATGKARIFDIKSDNVIIKNVIFMNGKVGQNKGGAIYWEGANGNLSNCIFTNNNAVYGGAVYWDGDHGTVSNCAFSQNSGKWNDFGWAGAVYWDGAFGTVSESTFAYNSAYSIGGAIYWGGMQGTVSGCEFVGNYLADEESFTSSGNAIYNTGNFFFF